MKIRTAYWIALVVLMASLSGCCMYGSKNVPARNYAQRESMESYDLSLVDEAGQVHELDFYQDNEGILVFRTETETGVKQLELGPEMQKIDFFIFLCSEDERSEDHEDRCVGSTGQHERDIPTDESNCPSHPQKEGSCTARYFADDVPMTMLSTGEKFKLRGHLTATFSMHHSEAHEECVDE